MSEKALTSFAVCDTYRYFTGQTQLLTLKCRPHTEYLRKN